MTVLSRYYLVCGGMGGRGDNSHVEMHIYTYYKLYYQIRDRDTYISIARVRCKPTCFSVDGFCKDFMWTGMATWQRRGHRWKTAYFIYVSDW